MEDENFYIDPETMIFLDEEWSDFLNSIPEQMGGTIKEGNEIFEHKVKRWCVKMGIKYKLNWKAIKKRYAHDY